MTASIISPELRTFVRQRAVPLRTTFTQHRQGQAILIEDMWQPDKFLAGMDEID